MKNGYAGAIIDRFIKEGFNILALKMTKLSAEKAGEFYAIHKERPFYSELVQFMSSGPIIAAILEKENAVTAFRDLIGSTNPAQAAHMAKLVPPVKGAAHSPQIVPIIGQNLSAMAIY